MNDKMKESLTPIGYLLHRMELAEKLYDNIVNNPGNNFLDLLIVGLRIAEGDQAPFDPMFMRSLAKIAVGAMYYSWGEEMVGFNLAQKEQANPDEVHKMATLLATAAALSRIKDRIDSGKEGPIKDEEDLQRRLSEEVGGDVHISTPEESGYEMPQPPPPEARP